ncbi:SDR family oxidoreductase [Gordonia polyisoprenivorans]|uniref:SDR family oxidoreductase n=1 Tax=Gordonia polyisoprenivorans TaxID=84595 RepID=UPI002300DBAC|nr:SDR family oxidoreductase [Gordonia polyisoprenivorans]WCB39945.1 SDR family oxidoreductase [Gordonia polyisoprenivorans]
MNQSLSGTTVLVIGGAKHLGLAIARRADAAGASVVIGARDLTAAQSAATDLDNGRAVAIEVTDEASIAAAAAELGAVDHIVSTAAAHHNVAVRDLDHDATVTAFEAKVIGPLLVAKHFGPRMPATGSITLFSGVAAWKPAPEYTVMGITNGAVAFAVSHLAAELAPVRVNAISPGIVDSGTWDGMPEADRDAFFSGVAEGIPARRVGTVDDIVDAAQWLLTAGFVSGETIHVEGGARSA